MHFCFFFVGLLICLISPLTLPLLAQPGAATATPPSLTASTSRETHPFSGPGYWRLKTDYPTRTTRITFYKANGEELYQEVLPGT